jgi:hypothetical protein
MPFIKNYKQAMDVLKSIETGKCLGRCRQSWLRNFKFALKTSTNPLKLTSIERKNMTKKMNGMKGKRFTLKQPIKSKYETRNSPPYPANENCNEIMVGNDGNKYESMPNKNGICTWRKI